MEQVSGWSEQGGSVVTVPGTQGSGAQRFQQSFRGATVTVRDSSNNLATIYSDDLASPTAKANPFTASSTTGSWSFFTTTGTYSITFSGGSITAPFSITVNVGLGNAGGVPSYAFASLPTSKTQNAGDIARVTNNLGSLWMDNGVQWSPVYPVLNAAMFAGADWVAKAQAAHDSVSTLCIIDCRYLSGTSASTLTLSKSCVLLLPNGTLTSTATRIITISISGVFVIGQGSGKSTLQWNPSGAGTAIRGEQTAASLVYAKLIGFTLDATGNTQTKTGVDLVDVNESLIEDFSIANFSNAGDTCNGVRIQGRQTLTMRRVSIAADQPIRLSISPNTAIVAADQYHFEDIYLIGATTQPLWLVDSGVRLTNCTWDGYQAWVGGSYGFYWTGFTHASLNPYALTFKNVRGEQAGGSGYLFYIDPTRQTFAVSIENCYQDSTNNFAYFRNCLNIALLENNYEGTTGIAINGNNTSYCYRRGNFWNINAGASLSVSGMLGVVVNEDETGFGHTLPQIELVGTGAIPPKYLINGGQIGLTISAYAVGTAYTLTTTPAALDFGTTDPSIVINKAGTYLISGRVVLRYVGATFPAMQTVIIKFRRTNNAASDLTNGTCFFETAIITTLTQTAMVIDLPTVEYGSLNTDDIITIFGSIDVLPSAGSITASEASIIALRIR